MNIIITRSLVSKDDISDWDDKHTKVDVRFIPLPLLHLQRIDSDQVKNSIEKVRQNYYDILIFLSVNAVNFFFEIMQEQRDFGMLFKNLSTMRSVAIGPKTMQALSNYNLTSEFPNNSDNYSSTEVVRFLINLEEINKKNNKRTRVGIPRSAESIKSDNLILLNLDTIILDQPFIYEVKDKRDRDIYKNWKKVIDSVKRDQRNFMVFTSPSAVRIFFNEIVTVIPHLVDKEDSDILNYLNINTVTSIGPKTSSELKKRGINFKESPIHTVRGVLKMIYKSI